MKHFNHIILSVFTLLLLASCSDKKDEPTNSVLALSSDDKNISITNGGLNAVINVSARQTDIIIKLQGTFVNTEIGGTSDWVRAKITDKELKLTVEINYQDKPRYANIAIKANNLAEVAVANIAINQAAPVDGDKDIWEIEDLLYVTNGNCYDIPSNGELEAWKWYRLYPDNSAFFRLINRESNAAVIKKGDIVYPDYVICDLWDMFNTSGPNWVLDNFYNHQFTTTPYAVTDKPSQEAIDIWGLGILDVLNKVPIHYGDDIDLIQTSYKGIPKFADKHEAYVYVVQYYATPGTQNNKPSIKKIRSPRSLR